MSCTKWIIFALSLAHNRRGPAAGRCIMNLYSIVPQFLILPAKCIVRGTKVPGVIVVGQSSFKFRAREREQ